MRKLELHYGFLTPREHDKRLENFTESIVRTVTAYILRSPIDLPFHAKLFSLELCAFFSYDLAPSEFISSEDVLFSKKQKDQERLARYEEQLKLWKREEQEKQRSSKFVWRSPAPVPR